MKLYRGSNRRELILTEDSCFTPNIETARAYAEMWAEDFGGEVTIHEVEGEFEKVYGPDEYRLISKKTSRIVE